VAYRLYLIPLTGVGTRADPRRPKYVEEASLSYGAMDYGKIGEAFVAADVTNAQHTALAANADVAALPTNLNTTVGTSNLAAVQNQLEAHSLPGTWITSTTTYRAIARKVAGLFQMAQRHHALHDETLIPSAASLGLTWGEIAADRRTRVQATAADLGYTLTGITDGTSVRQVLGTLADQWGVRAFTLGGLTF
jgi:hypothetical protein